MGRFDDIDDKGGHGPLDEFGREIEARVGRRDGGRRSQGVFTISARALPLVGALALVVLALSATSTIMLWQIADQTASNGNSNSSNSEVAEPPPLPNEPHRGTTSERLAGELDKLSNDFAAPLRQLDDQLAPLSNASKGLETFPATLAQSNKTFNRVSANLNTLVSQVEGLSGTQHSLEKVADSTKGLNSVAGTLKKVSKSIATFDQAADSLEKMRKDIGAFNTVAGKTDAVNASIMSMLQKLDDSNARLKSLDSLNASFNAMNQSLTALNSVSQSLAQMNALAQRLTAALNGLCKLWRENPEWGPPPPGVCP